MGRRGNAWPHTGKGSDIKPTPHAPSSSTFMCPLPCGPQFGSLEGAFTQNELFTPGEFITSLYRFFLEATLGLQVSCELVLSLHLVSSVAFPVQIPAQHCFFERVWGNTSILPEQNMVTTLSAFRLGLPLLTLECPLGRSIPEPGYLLQHLVSESA